MAKLTNPSKRDITLPAGHVIPREGELITTDDVFGGDNAPVLNGLIASGQIIAEYDAAPELPKATKAKAI